jgi:transposase
LVILFKNILFRQRAVIEFLVKEEIPATDIYHRLQRVYGDTCMGASSVRQWVNYFKGGNTSFQDQPRNGRPRTASTEHNKKRVDEIITEDRRVTLGAIATKLGIGHNSVQGMIGSLGYGKMCARWVPRLLTGDHKVQRKSHPFRNAWEMPRQS